MKFKWFIIILLWFVFVKDDPNSNKANIIKGGWNYKSSCEKMERIFTQQIPDKLFKCINMGPPEDENYKDIKIIMREIAAEITEQSLFYVFIPKKY